MSKIVAARQRLVEELRRRASFRKQEGDHGFSLVELLIYMVIVGILVAIAIPALAAYRKDGYVTSIKDDLKSAATAMESSYTLNNVYPTTIADVQKAGYRPTNNVWLSNPVMFTGSANNGPEYCIQGFDGSINKLSDFYYYLSTTKGGTPTGSTTPVAGTPTQGTCAAAMGTAASTYATGAPAPSTS